MAYPYGGNVIDLTKPLSQTKRRKPLTAKQLDQMVEKTIAEFKNIEEVWNFHAMMIGLPIRMDVGRVIKLLRDNYDMPQFEELFNRTDDAGILHEPQIKTIINIIYECIRHPEKCGLVLGALQAGKTLTAIALQWLGPVNYILTNERIRLIYLITSHTSHEDQTQQELKRFVNFYGLVEFWGDGDRKRCSLNEYRKLIKYNTHPMHGEQSVFARKPNLINYRNNVIDSNSYDGSLEDDRLFLQRRVHGVQIWIIANLAKRMKDDGMEPLFIVDEAQFGASDRDPVEGGSSGKSVMRQIMERTASAVTGKDTVTDEDFIRYIAFSATPFELYDVSSGVSPNTWCSNMLLSPSYVGFNYFGGSAICGGVDVRTPECVSFTDFGCETNNDLLAEDQFSFSAWSLPHRYSASTAEKKFATWAKKCNYEGDWNQYDEDFVASMRAMILSCINSEKTPVGVCVRLCNNNNITEKFIERLALPEQQAQVLSFFNQQIGTRSTSVKRFIFENADQNIPYVIFVTNKARMGDAFPKDVKFFIECPEKATTLNALLQGLLGRSCGYGYGTKLPTVIMSEHNVAVIHQWMRTKGGHVYRGSPHVIPVNLRRGPKTNMLRIRTDMDDSIIQEFWKRLNAEVVMPNLDTDDNGNLKPSKFLPTRTRFSRKGQGEDGDTRRRAPILRIAREVGLFDHLEKPEVREKLFPEFITGFQIVRGGKPGDGSASDLSFARTRNGIPAKYVERMVKGTPTGEVEFTFRYSNSASVVHSTRAQRTDRAKKDNVTLDPQINMEKYDPTTGKVIDEGIGLPRNHPDHIPTEDRVLGLFRAHMITFPLVEAKAQIEIGTAQLPRYRCLFSRHMTDEQREARDAEEFNISERAAARKKRS